MLHHYTFRVRTPGEGAQPAARPSSWPAVKLGDSLFDPRWSGASFAHGDAATMVVDAPGLDGRTVRFVVEHQHRGQWSKQAELTATVRGGKASAGYQVKHPAPGDEAENMADLRFHCEVVEE